MGSFEDGMEDYPMPMSVENPHFSSPTQFWSNQTSLVWAAYPGFWDSFRGS